jgi:hypothetical protein
MGVTQFGKHLRPEQAELKRQELIRSERSEEEKLKKHLTTKYSNTRTNRERATSYKSPIREVGKICTDVNCSLTVKGPWFPHSHSATGGLWPAWPARHMSATKSKQQKSLVRAYPSRDDTYFKSFINKQ